MPGKKSVFLKKGDVFGSLTIEKELEKDSAQRRFLCKCLCGRKTEVYMSNLRAGNTNSCGCMIGNSKVTHGESKTSFYKKYASIKSRCTDANNNNYKYYGGRGIKCTWDSYESFRDEMYESYVEHVKEFGQRNTTIDRIDVNGDYSKENCRWATCREQIENRRYRKTRFYEIYGKKYTISELALIHGINRATICSRIKNGMSISDALVKTNLRVGD